MKVSKINEFGRSMIEMLGVLAIIGVLSVGAIAGYQKAMFKYKLNKHAEAVSFLINTILQMKESLPKPSFGASMSYNSILDKLNFLPDGIYLANYFLEDRYFDISMHVEYNRDKDGNKYNDSGNLIFYLGAQADYRADICRNIIFAAKENSANLWQLTAYRSGENKSAYIRFYGDKYCDNTNLKCISKISLEDSNSLCLGCVEFNKCDIFTSWK